MDPQTIIETVKQDIYDLMTKEIYDAIEKILNRIHKDVMLIKKLYATIDKLPEQHAFVPDGLQQILERFGVAPSKDIPRPPPAEKLPSAQAANKAADHGDETIKDRQTTNEQTSTYSGHAANILAALKARPRKDYLLEDIARMIGLDPKNKNYGLYLALGNLVKADALHLKKMLVATTVGKRMKNLYRLTE